MKQKDSKKIIISENEAEQRIDRFIKKFFPTAPIGLIYKYLRQKKIKVNGKKTAQNYRLQIGDIVQFDPCIHPEQFIGKEKNSYYDYEKEFAVVYEDENLLIVDKPAGLLTHKDRSGAQNTLNTQVLSYLMKKGDYNPEKELTFKPGPSNRLDRNTSGLVLFAKRYQTQQVLNEMVRQKMIDKFYLALVIGEVQKDQELKGYLYKDPKTNQVVITDEKMTGASPIHTSYKVLKRNQGFTLLEVKLISGKTHQIRAHLASIGYPILGDPKYGDDKLNRSLKLKLKELNRQFLHAYRLVFAEAIEPLVYLKNKEIQVFLPGDLELIENYLGLNF